MTTIAIIHGGGDSASSWEPACAQLRALGDEPIAVDMPLENPDAGWADYAQTLANAVRGHRDLVVVAHSLGGFAAPLVCEFVPVRRIVLVAAMIPTPGAIASNYWSDAGYQNARCDDEAFSHDLSPDAIALAKRAEREHRDRVMDDPWPLAKWPDVSTRYLLCRDDRVFPAERTRELVQERLGIQADEIDGGHCVYLARPEELAQRLHQYGRQP